MKSIKYLNWFFLAVLSLVIACKKNEYALDKMMEASQLSFEVVQDLVVDPGGNTVYLINTSPETVPMWDYGTGKSTRQRDTIRFAFKGDYVIKYSAVTDGGIVEKEPVTITVTEDNLNYVNDPKWTALSGGVGEEKTWLLDLDANGVSKFWKGPVYFSSNNYDPSTDCLSNGSCWIWEADWPNNTWIGDKGDYGTMTFNLKGGPFVKVDHKMNAALGVQNGTFFLDANTNMLTMTGAQILQNANAKNDIGDWTNLKIISLTENTMQLAAKHKSKAEYMIFNFISKEYNDNWIPPAPPQKLPDEGFNPTFAPGELLTMLTGGANSGRFWTLDVNGNPIDWVAKGNGWTVNKSSSYNWGWNESWETAVSNAWIRFDQIGGNNYTRFQNGVTTNGTFTIDEATNEITLIGNTLLQNPASWMNPTTNKLKVVKAYNADYRTKGIWFGTSYDGGKDEWFVFHYIIP